LPGDVAYTASKFAVEVRRNRCVHEVDRWGIHLALVEPRHVRNENLRAEPAGESRASCTVYPAEIAVSRTRGHKACANCGARIPHALDPGIIAELLVQISRSDGSQLRWPADATARKVLATMFAQDDAARDAFLRGVLGNRLVEPRCRSAQHEPAGIIFPAKGQVRLEPFRGSRPGPSTEVRVHTLYSLMSIRHRDDASCTRNTIRHALCRAILVPAAEDRRAGIACVEQAGDESASSAAATSSSCAWRTPLTGHLTPHSVRPCPRTSISSPRAGAVSAKTAFRTAHAAPFRLAAAVLIVGAGPVGQMAIAVATAAGTVPRLASSTCRSCRLELATRAGATECHRGALGDLYERLLGSSDDGFELVVDTTGNPACFTAALAVTAKFGKLVLLG
jgi:hypothetical protein